MESEVLKSMGFKGKNFKNAWRKFEKNVKTHRATLKQQREEQNLREQEEIAAINAMLRNRRIARELEEQQLQEERNRRQAIINREQRMRNELQRINRELQPNYIEVSKRLNREEQKRKSRKARGKNYNRYTTKSRQNSSPNTPRTNKRNKTRARNTLRKSRQNLK
jgi:hypothetical protein